MDGELEWQCNSLLVFQILFQRFWKVVRDFERVDMAF